MLVIGKGLSLLFGNLNDFGRTWTMRIFANSPDVHIYNGVRERVWVCVCVCACECIGAWVCGAQWFGNCSINNDVIAHASLIRCHWCFRVCLRAPIGHNVPAGQLTATVQTVGLCKYGQQSIKFQLGTVKAAKSLKLADKHVCICPPIWLHFFNFFPGRNKICNSN